MSIEVKRRVGGTGWRWQASYRPSGSERITLHGHALTANGAKRKANRAMLRIVQVAQGLPASDTSC